MINNNDNELDLTLVTCKSIHNMPIKITVFLFFIYLFISSDIWYNMLLKWNIVNNNINIMTQQAYIFNAIILSILFLILQYLIENNII